MIIGSILAIAFTAFGVLALIDGAQSAALGCAMIALLSGAFATWRILEETRGMRGDRSPKGPQSPGVAAADPAEPTSAEAVASFRASVAGLPKGVLPGFLAVVFTVYGGVQLLFGNGPAAAGNGVLALVAGAIALPPTVERVRRYRSSWRRWREESGGEIAQLRRVGLIVLARSARGQTLLEKGDPAGAVRATGRAVARLRRRRGTELFLAVLLSNLAIGQGASGDRSAARDSLDESARIFAALPLAQQAEAPEFHVHLDRIRREVDAAHFDLPALMAQLFPPAPGQPSAAE